jgi:hypothetical protein
MGLVKAEQLCADPEWCLSLLMEQLISARRSVTMGYRVSIESSSNILSANAYFQTPQNVFAPILAINPCAMMLTTMFQVTRQEERLSSKDVRLEQHCEAATRDKAEI